MTDTDDWEKALTFVHTESRRISDLYKKGGHIGDKVSLRNYRIKFDNRRFVDVDRWIEDGSTGVKM